MASTLTRSAIHDKKPNSNVTYTHKERKHKVPAEVVDDDDIKDDWELVELADVQPSHLEVMDLTDLSSSLLEHPKGLEMEYTAEEKKALETLLDKAHSRDFSEMVDNEQHLESIVQTRSAGAWRGVGI